MTATGRLIRNGTLLICFTTTLAGVSPAQSAPSYSRRLQEVKYNKSWIAIDWSALEGPLVEGDKIRLPVEYFLDPTEHFRTTSLKLEALGPRVPKAGARDPISFDNTQHLWYGDQSVKIAPGRGRHIFPLTIPRASPQNDLLLLALFADSQGKRWPWDVRAGAWYARKGGFFELETEKPGNLFTDDQPVRVIVRLKNVTEAGARKVLTYKVYDFTKALVAEGSVPFSIKHNGQKIGVGLKLARRGTFVFEAEVAGWEQRDHVLPHSRPGQAHRGQANPVGVHVPRRTAGRLAHGTDVRHRPQAWSHRLPVVHGVEIDRARSGALCARALGPLLRRGPRRRNGEP